MDPIAWLEGNSDGFKELSAPEREAAKNFTLIWSYFEAKALGSTASTASVSAWIRDLDSRGGLNATAFTETLEYFKSRYFFNGNFTNSFDSLYLRPNDNPQLVREVMSGTNASPVDTVVALFIIFYRFRNNYFHGPKWAYDLRNQLQNFTAAIDSIIAAMDMARAR